MSVKIQESTYWLPESGKGLDVPLFETEFGAAESPCARPRTSAVVLADDEPPHPQTEPACDQNCAYA
jgi:hypothetical protein